MTRFFPTLKLTAALAAVVLAVVIILIWRASRAAKSSTGLAARFDLGKRAWHAFKTSFQREVGKGVGSTCNTVLPIMTFANKREAFGKIFLFEHALRSQSGFGPSE